MTNAAIGRLTDSFTQLNAALIGAGKAAEALAAEFEAHIERELARLTDGQRSVYFRLVAEGSYKLDAIGVAKLENWHPRGTIRGTE